MPTIDGPTVFATYSRFLDVTAAVRNEDGRESVVLWLEFDDGSTFKVQLSLDDGRDLIRATAEAIAVFDED